jgi:membrane-bound lytic murein transglycosylase MltF
VPLQDIEAGELLQLNRPLQGDLPEMRQRRFIRALVPFSRSYYYLDGAGQRGLAYEVLTELEKTIAAQSPKGTVPPKIVIIPTSRDRLMRALTEGYGDVAVGGFTVLEARQEFVDFSNSTKDNIRDVVVTSPGGPSVSREEDLSGLEVQVPASSVYIEDLETLNTRLASKNLAPVKIRVADAVFEDEDLLQMVDAGIVPVTVTKDHIAHAWAALYDQIRIHDDVALREGGQQAIALRKNMPQFMTLVNEFVRTHRTGTLFGNMMFKRYFGDGDRLKNSMSQGEVEKFRTLVGYFQQSGAEFDLDWILIGAQAYQESQLDQGRRSSAGAVGVMQIKPETAADPNVGIPNVQDVRSNIRAGTKYLRFMIDRYYADAPMDRLNKGLFALASYNAGPARVARLRQKAQAMGLDQNVWFRNVEIVASRDIGKETVDYVSNIYKYYTAYTAIAAARTTRERAQQSLPK